MADISEWVPDFSARERATLDAALRSGESLRWAVRPLCRFDLREWAVFAFAGAIGLSFVASACLMLWQLRAHPPESSLFMALAACFFLCFLLEGFHLLSLPLLEQRRRRRTLYVLTNHRALVVAPGGVRAFPLCAGMVRERISRPGGAGDLILEGEGEDGFTRLPNLAQAHAELNLAIHALMDDAERHRGNRAQNS